MTKYLSLIGFLALAACQNQGLNPEALDLNRYVINLSESGDKFPAYIRLMGTDNCGVPLSLDEFSFITPKVVPCEVKRLQSFFGDNSKHKQLHLIGHSQADLNARIFAYAVSNKDIRLLEINEEQFAQDSQVQSWTDSEKGAVVEAIFKRFNDSKTIFVVNAGFAPISSDYSVIYKSLNAPSPKVPQMKLRFVHLPELVSYAEALDGNARKAAVLLFAFAPEQSFLGNIEGILEASKNIISAEDSAVEAVYRLLGNKPDVKQKMLAFQQELQGIDADLLMEISKQVLEQSDYFFNSTTQQVNSVFEYTKKTRKRFMNFARSSAKSQEDLRCKFEDFGSENQESKQKSKKENFEDNPAAEWPTNANVQHDTLLETSLARSSR